MSRKNRKIKDIESVDPIVDSCDHVDDDNDGTCDLCGVEVEVDSGDADPAPEEDGPKVVDPTPENSAPTYVVRDNVGCPFYRGKTYHPGDVMPLRPEEYRSWQKFVEVR